MGVLYAAYVATATFGGSGLVRRWSSKGCLVAGLGLLAAYVGCFLAAVAWPAGAAPLVLVRAHLRRASGARPFFPARKRSQYTSAISPL